jgi:hypothetical protein
MNLRQTFPAIGSRWIYADVGDGEGLVWHKLLVFRVGRGIAGNQEERKELLKSCALWTWPMGGPEISKWMVIGPDLPVRRGEPLNNDEVGLLVPKRWWCFVRWVARLLALFEGRGCSPTYSYFWLERS